MLAAKGGEESAMVIQHGCLDIIQDAALNHQKQVRGEGAALSDARAGDLFCASMAHGPDCKCGVVVDALYDVDELLVHAKTAK